MDEKPKTLRDAVDRDLERGQRRQREFFASMERVGRWSAREGSPLVVTPRLIDRAHADVERLGADADEAMMRSRHLRRGWRRFRFGARRRAAERYLDARAQADALAVTFGRRV